MRHIEKVSIILFFAVSTAALPELRVVEGAIDEFSIAASQNGWKVSESTLAFLQNDALKYEVTFEEIGKLPNQDDIGRILSEWLEKKSKVAPDRELEPSDLGDFSWSYIAANSPFVPVRIRARETFTLKGAMVNSNFEAAFVTNPEVNHGDVIVIPLYSSGGLDGKYEIEVKTRQGRAVAWTGNGESIFVSSVEHSQPIDINLPSSSRGCEIYVNSEPDKATVLFNDDEWYDPTNTAVVQDPGHWKVLIKKAGYEDWESEREMEAGDSWTIDATLVKVD